MVTIPHSTQPRVGGAVGPRGADLWYCCLLLHMRLERDDKHDIKEVSHRHARQMDVLRYMITTSRCSCVVQHCSTSTSWNDSHARTYTKFIVVAVLLKLRFNLDSLASLSQNGARPLLKHCPGLKKQHLTQLLRKGIANADHVRFVDIQSADGFPAVDDLLGQHLQEHASQTGGKNEDGLQDRWTCCAAALPGCWALPPAIQVCLLIGKSGVCMELLETKQTKFMVETCRLRHAHQTTVEHNVTEHTYLACCHVIAFCCIFDGFVNFFLLKLYVCGACSSTASLRYLAEMLALLLIAVLTSNLPVYLALFCP